MFSTIRSCVAAFFVATAASLLWAGQSQAQSPRRPTRLSVLQQQNAFQQQQNAVQSAVQQTNLLTQTNFQQSGAASSMLQQQQSALQIALQQTNVLLQGSYRKNTALSQTALRQLNTLQTALQQTIAVQSILSTLSGEQIARQLRTLSQQQGALTQLLGTPPPLQRGTSNR